MTRAVNQSEKTGAADLIERSWRQARATLLAERRPEGYWLGELSASALATATAVSAFSAVDSERFSQAIARGVSWLKRSQNADGGWGDSPESPSNLSTTMLVEAALRLSKAARAGDETARGMRKYLRKTGGESGEERARRLTALYGDDRSFAAPILANCALASSGQTASEDMQTQIQWSQVGALPFELARLPRALLGILRLQVVSYALPALIAIGQLVHAKNPSRNPLIRLARNAAVEPTLRLLEKIQPESGGFLEAVPLTAFTVMSLAACGRSESPVVKKGIEFLENSARPDGSWPIDSNLSNWLTSLSVQALSAGNCEPDGTLNETLWWLLRNQRRTRHPYTGSKPGGWGWTHLSGCVPDADDTAGTLLALAELGEPENSKAASSGLRWLLDLQNGDGGWPTFCRGWGKLAFDRSAPDLTAHALRALWAWRRVIGAGELRRAVSRGIQYLERAQRADGAWTPLWFGSQHTRDRSNGVFGTARVLAAWRDLGRREAAHARRGVAFLLSAQNGDGAWGAEAGAPPTVEETACAVEALSGWIDDEKVRAAAHRGAHYLARRMNGENSLAPSPIGLYFALLWYSERLYPLVWTVGALGRLVKESNHFQVKEHAHNPGR